MPTSTGEEIVEVVLLEDRPELGLHAGESVGLAKSVATPLVTPPAPASGVLPASKAKLKRRGL